MTKPRKQFRFKNYYKPTPVFWRKIGDSMLAATTVIAVGGLWDFNNLTQYLTHNEIRFLIGSSIVLGIVGKTLSNFFTKEDNNE